MALPIKSSTSGDADRGRHDSFASAGKPIFSSKKLIWASLQHRITQCSDKTLMAVDVHARFELGDEFRAIEKASICYTSHKEKL